MNKLRNYFNELAGLDLKAFNNFILRHVVVHVFRTQNIIPLIISISIVGFSILIYAANFLFIPQASITALVPLFVFLLAISLIIIIMYPLVVILFINYLCGYWKSNSLKKVIAKLGLLILFLVIGVIILAEGRFSVEMQIEVFIIWFGLDLILVELYLAQNKHNNMLKLSSLRYTLIIVLSLLLARPMTGVFIHTTEVMNIISINPIVNLSAQNCDLIKTPNEGFNLPPDNLIFGSQRYYTDANSTGGCKLKKNIIRYGFAGDYMLLIKKNIYPFRLGDGKSYNEYVRLICYSGNCYAKNGIFRQLKGDEDNKLLSD